MTKLIHITGPYSALRIMSQRAYASKKNYGSYDAGMNFLGILGEYENTQPKRGVRIHCEWKGAVSSPLQHDEFNCHTPNTLFDFNGSGNHFPNNDPRYFLPYGSSGLIINKIELESAVDEELRELLVEAWCQLKGGIVLYFYENNLFKKLLQKYALDHLDKVNKMLAHGATTIVIERSK